MTATMDATMRVLVWLVEGTWQGCVDAARPLLPPDAEITLLHVAPSEVEQAATGALAGLLGRGRPGPGRHTAGRISALSVLLVWPDEAPGVGSIPPPPPPPPRPGPPPPPPRH